MSLSEPPIIWLAEDFEGPFPSASLALLAPDGLLAAGANLKPETLLQAYSQGIFPWYSEGQPILWWSPNPRCVLYPEKFHVSRSLKRTLNQQVYEIRCNTAFRDVMQKCAEPRPDQPDTWILSEMIDAYCTLHQAGKALSVECWFKNELVGGIYGIFVNNIFYGESMFSRMKDASKVAMHHLCFSIQPHLIDAQIESEHLLSLGAETIDRDDFISEINKSIES